MSQKKKARVFSPEFKLKAIERMMAGESARALAHEFKLLRKLLYAWKDAYISGGAGALRTRGRPRRTQVLGPAPVPTTERAELLQARKKIADLERLVGRQQLENDFFAKALRHLEELQPEKANGAQSSTKPLGRKHRKAD
jgi:transposase